jgi:bifunctional ADP-heptose synthase (sugar kinase/adenylyltransferase)
VGAEDVKGWGGRVELVPLVPSLSTSEIVRRASGA